MSSGVHTFFTHCEWEEGGQNQPKALEIREVQSKVWTSPNWTSWQRSNREGLAPLTKKQYSGTWALDKGAIERVCAAEWLRRLSEGFGQGAQIELKIYLHAFSDSVNCQTAGNSIIQNSRLAIIGFHSSRPQRVGINKRLGVEKTSTSFEIWASLGSWMLYPF